jgi:hypothetical protein
MGDGRSEHRWPFVRAAGRVLDFLTPFDVAKEYACKLFLEPTVGKACLRQGDDELEVTFDTSEVPHLGVWINKGGWTPFRRERPYLNLAIEPCLGAPDALSDALGDWKRAQWLEPGEVDPSRVSSLLAPYPADEMAAFPVSPLVNNPRNESPDLVQPAR